MVFIQGGAPRNCVECDVKQCKINGVEYLFLSFDV